MHFTTKKFEQTLTENKRLINDNEDLQHEFELDRQGYLETIRIQEQQILLYRTIAERMSGLMQRHCNYTNLDKIIEQSRYDEERNLYHIPDVITEDIQLPQVGKSLQMNNGRTMQQDFNSPSVKSFIPPPINYEYESAVPSQPTSSHHNQRMQMNSEELERRYGRGIDASIVPNGNVRNKRQEQLLSENARLQNNKIRPLPINNPENDYMNRRLNPFDSSVRLGRKYGFSTDKQ